MGMVDSSLRCVKIQPVCRSTIASTMPPESSRRLHRTHPPSAPGVSTEPPVVAFAMFKRLDTCHADIEARLERLRALAVALAHDGLTRTARAEARTALNWFNETGRQHHRDEEEIVFPILLASDDQTLVERTRRLIQDHAWLDADWQRIAPMLKAAADGSGGFEPVVLRQAVEVYVQLQRDHMAREESLAYPEARQRLVPDLHRKSPLAAAPHAQA